MSRRHPPSQPLDKQQQQEIINTITHTNHTHSTIRYYSLLLCVALLLFAFHLPHGVIALYILADHTSPYRNKAMIAFIITGIISCAWKQQYTGDLIVAGIVAIKVGIVENVEEQQKKQVQEIEKLQYEFESV